MVDDKNDVFNQNKSIVHDKNSNLPDSFRKNIENDELALETPESALEKWRTNRIKRKAAIKIANTYFDEKRKVAEQQIKQAAHLKNEETIVEANRYLKELDQRQIKYLTEFGMKNVEMRSEAMIRLQEQRAKLIRTVNEKDIDDQMKNQVIEGITKLHNEFFKKLSKELEELETESKD